MSTEPGFIYKEEAGAVPERSASGVHDAQCTPRRDGAMRRSVRYRLFRHPLCSVNGEVARFGACAVIGADFHRGSLQEESRAQTHRLAVVATCS
ncbi:unnamed protein product [Lampetra planeri]